MRHVIALSLALLGSACSTSATQAPLPHAAPPDVPPTAAAAEKLVVDTAGCWMGDFWSDANGKSPEDRPQDVEARCRDIMQRASVLPADYLALRAVEPRVVEQIAQVVRALGVREGLPIEEQESLDALFRAVSDAQRESMYARRAADTVKDDLSSQPSPEERARDKEAARGPLSRSSDLSALWELAANHHSYDARALALLNVLDRVEIARGLPKHLQLEVLRGPFALVFHVPPPALPSPASTPILNGELLAYFEKAATAAGHPVPSGTETDSDRMTLAWLGTMEGISDRLGEEIQHVSLVTALPGVTRRIMARVESELTGTEETLSRVRALGTEGTKGIEKR